jgi:hypothetical protein
LEAWWLLICTTSNDFITFYQGIFSAKMVDDSSVAFIPKLAGNDHRPFPSQQWSNEGWLRLKILTTVIILLL